MFYGILENQTLYTSFYICFTGREKFFVCFVCVHCFKKLIIYNLLWRIVIPYGDERIGMKLYNPTSFSTVKINYPTQKIECVISSRMNAEYAQNEDIYLRVKLF